MTQPVQLSAEQFQDLLTNLRAGPTVGNNGGNAESTSRPVKAVLPTIDVDTTEGEWDVFEDNWGRYKRMAKLTVITEIRDNLRQCCTIQLNKRLFDVKGPATLNAATEDDLLAWIKEIAVKAMHTEVHRTQFVNCKQKQGENLSAFHGSLKSKSSLCDFRVAAPSTCANNACTCANHGMQVSYQDDMVATQLVAGLYNAEHQAKILSESGTLVTLKEKLERLTILEKSEISLSSLGNSEAFSNYAGAGGKSRDGQKKRWEKWKKKDKDAARQTNTVGNTCAECGQKHPQCTVCQGYHKCTTKCNLCKTLGHIKNCCPKMAELALSAAAATLRMSAPNAPNEDEEDVVFGFSISVTAPSMDVLHRALSVQAHQISKHLLSHMEFGGDSFRSAKPAKAPIIQVICKVFIGTHAVYGRRSQGVKKSTTADGLADTGAQVCTAGPGLLSHFHIDQDYLIPTRLEVKGIANFPVTMMGALFLKVCPQCR